VREMDPEILDIELWGNCDLCENEDVKIWIFIDVKRKGHKLCKACIETLVEWGLIEKPGFELEES